MWVEFAAMDDFTPARADSKLSNLVFKFFIRLMASRIEEEDPSAGASTGASMGLADLGEPALASSLKTGGLSCIFVADFLLLIII